MDSRMGQEMNKMNLGHVALLENKEVIKTKKEEGYRSHLKEIPQTWEYLSEKTK